jgi:hypothetical protein
MSSPHDNRTFEDGRQGASRPVVSTTQARQGVTGHNVRYVLGFSMLGIVVAFAIIYLFYFG